MDIVLSAGWLAFYRHLGFLEALGDLDVSVDAVVGTSSGSLVGALWAAGLSLDAIADEVSATRPLSALRLSRRPWSGLCAATGLMNRLRRHLPARIEDLDRPFAVGVSTWGRRSHLLTEGPLVEAVAASCAVPGLFSPVDVDGTRWLDGGWADRAAVPAWRQWRPGHDGIVHLIESMRERLIDPPGVRVVRSASSGATLWNLGEGAAQRAESRARTLAVLDAGCD